MSSSSSSSAEQPRSETELLRLLHETDPEQLLPLLLERGFVAAPDSTVEFVAGPADAQLDRTGAVAHIDPRHPTATATLAGARMGMYVHACTLSTEAEPPYLRLPSILPSSPPYLIAYLFGFPPGETRNVRVGMQVYSAVGTVSVTATGNPTGVTVGFTSFPNRCRSHSLTTTTAEGFASVSISRIGSRCRISTGTRSNFLLKNVSGNGPEQI